MLYRAVLGTLLLGVLGTAHAADPIEALANTCNNCHGVNGVSVGPNMPSIGGQPEAYLKNVMLEWKSGARYSATMGRLIKGYSDEQIGALAAYFSKKPWVPVAQKTDDAQVKRGKQVTARCLSCHGIAGEGGDDETPKLNGQWAQYLEMELMKYRDESVAMPHKKMRNTAKKMEEGDVAAAAQYYARQQK